MSRGWRAFTSLLLVAAFALLAVPVGLNLAQAVEWPAAGPEPVVSTPAAQQAPRGLSAAPLLEAEPPAAPAIDSKVLGKALDEALKYDGAGDITAIVTEASSGEVVYDRGGSEPRVPASNMKLLTAAAALSTMGADARFSTEVVRGTSPGAVVLRAGGDALLGAGESKPDEVRGHAGLQTLAEAAAKRIGTDDYRGSLKVQLDDSAFAGPVINPAWAAADVQAGEIAPIHPIALHGGRVRSDGTGAYAPDPGLAAAQAFRDALAEAVADRGIKVEAEVERRDAADDAPVLAAVESATVGAQANYMLLHSDNYVAEVLARNLALASGKPGSFGGGTEAIKEALAQLEIPLDGLLITDACGLSLGNRVSAVQIAAVVREITSGSNVHLRAALDGLPVAGLSGTLDGRFTGGAAGGAGLVRAKTGTLNAVTSLGGYAVSPEGHMFIFAFVANGLQGSAEPPRAAVDRAAAVLAGCGCR
ncbi:D-alanyl-D-alanine carboxypeptidase/D-alanyl-D-alanine-endopeptidase [Arthrobacter crystallopoietes BAB-32]|uniref:D-alanyl-D-alanine carboxypeptidase/D-alanyl-D-alanine-endopeptidase n=1 Tax=Arthrobacter crystallopoietes BAB-32 TaxID=1246476 RepID=N1UYS1_9MICC|nr:D-alanyl-D-alanine carboxypeptidase/D-alanyl-D-alanine-endopeptidase [Arthrobacter crystallopoietes]EMY34200.1 D-alanyl-D-alanine carboxypeptidase/D-alanyl-D-alanine-endopeptidase [Arthrobacter crystallopoietes BAB-32]